MVDGGPTTTLPRSLDARVRELLHLLSTAVFERKVAIANAFRGLPPLRQFGDAERLGFAFPPPTQAVWNAYLDTSACEPVGSVLRFKHAALIKFQDGVIRFRVMRTKLADEMDQLRNEWHTRQATGEVASNPVDRERDTRADLAYRANERLRATQPDALRELAARFGASSLSDETPPPPPLSRADCFEKELDVEFAHQHARVVAEETKLAEEWRDEYEKELGLLRMHQLIPLTGLEGQPIDVIPNPSMASKEAMRTMENTSENYNAEIKRKLARWSHRLEIHHTDVIAARMRANLASSARQHQRMLERANESGDETDRRAVQAFSRRTLQPIKDAYEDVLVRAMERLQGVYEFRTSLDIKRHITSETLSPLSDEALAEVIDQKEAAISDRDRMAEKLRQGLGKWGPPLALYDSLENRLMEAYEVRRMHDADPQMETTIDVLTPRLLQIFTTSPWHERNHRGGLGVDEAIARIQGWLVSFARTHGLQVNTRRINFLMEREEPRASSSNPNEYDYWRPVLPHRTIGYSAPLPTLAVAAKVATAALRRRVLVAARALR